MRIKAPNKWAVVYACLAIAALTFGTSPGMAKKKGGGGGGGNPPGVAVSLSTDGSVEAVADVSVEKPNESVACPTLAVSSPGFFDQATCGSGNGWKTYTYSITAGSSSCSGTNDVGSPAFCGAAILNAF